MTRLVITVDTEEDNWGGYGRDTFTTENIERLPELQALLDEFGLVPTYLLSYPVVKSQRASEILGEILRRRACEIGAHCHPWNTPPLEEASTPENRMLCNLPGELQYRKMAELHAAILERFGTVPVAFRSGRWGYNAAVAGNLERLGYTIDTSVTPYIDWARQRGPDFRAAAPRPYRFTPPDVLSETPAGALVEVPATIGLLRFEFAPTNRAVAAAARAALARPRLRRLLSRLRILNTIWLSPEVSTGREMIRLARTLVRKGCPLLNLVFHSSALQAGLTPFVKDVDDERRFRARLREFLAFTRAEGIEPMRLSAVKTLL